MIDQKQGGFSEKKMEQIVRNILIGMLGIVIITLLSLRIYEEVLKNEQEMGNLQIQKFENEQIHQPQTTNYEPQTILFKFRDHAKV